MQLVKYSYRLMLELATSQPRTAPLRPRYLGIKQIIGLSGEKKRGQLDKKKKKMIITDWGLLSVYSSRPILITCMKGTAPCSCS